MKKIEIIVPDSVEIKVTQISDTSTVTPTPVIQPVPSKPNVVSAFEGWLDIVDATGISGWAWDKNNPTSQITVDVYVDNVKMGAVNASNLRQDLLTAGKGDGKHAFSISIPDKCKDGLPHVYSVNFGGSPISLGLSCGVNANFTYTTSTKPVVQPVPPQPVVVTSPTPVAPVPVSPTPTPNVIKSNLAISWEVRKMPRDNTQPGPNSELKHVRFAQATGDSRVFMYGGDYGGPVYPQSYRQELYSYSVSTGIWFLEYPYVARAGEINPSHPDQMGWDWDPIRKVFWSVPGEDVNDVAHQTPGSVIRQVMSFDPATGKWSQPTQGLAPYGASTPPHHGRCWKDIMFLMAQDRVYWWNILDGTWHQEVTYDPDGTTTRYMQHSYQEIVGDNGYAIDGVNSIMWCCNIPTVIAIQGNYANQRNGTGFTRYPMPWKASGNESLFIVYASHINALVVIDMLSHDNPADDASGQYYQLPQIWLFHLDTQKWEQVFAQGNTIPGSSPKDATGAIQLTHPRCYAAFYDKVSKKIGMFGGLEPGNDEMYLLSLT